jgi:hypothetical protein
MWAFSDVESAVNLRGLQLEASSFNLLILSGLVSQLEDQSGDDGNTFDSMKGHYGQLDKSLCVEKKESVGQFIRHFDNTLLH